jgi:hypothetical protein
MVSTCRVCGRTDGRWERELSRHRTSQGEVVYTRCTCGSIAVRLLLPRPLADACVLVQSRAPEPVMDLLAGAGRRDASTACPGVPGVSG